MRNKILIYVKRNSIEFISPEYNIKTLKFPEKILDDLEIINSEGFKKTLLKFLVSESIKPQRATIVLSEEITFQKITKIKDSGKKQQLIESFLDEIPVEPEKILHDSFNVSSGTLIIAVNGNLIHTLVASFKEHKWKITSVIPEIFYGKVSMNGAKAAEILANEKTNAQISLIKDTANKSIKWGLLGMILLAIACIGVFASLYINFIKTSKETKVIEENIQQQTIDSVDTQETPVEEEAQEIDKTQYSLLILNGTGVPGLASQTKETFENVGYKDIEIGNSTSIGNIETTVEFNDGVPSDLIEELTEELYKSFDDVVEIKNEEENEYDITITTGSLLTEE